MLKCIYKSVFNIKLYKRYKRRRKNEQEKNGKSAQYNNDSNSWVKSLYNLDAIKDNIAFVKVGDDWHNSFISVSEAKEYFSLINEAQKPSTIGKALSFFVTKAPISEQEGSKQDELLYVGINKNNKLQLLVSFAVGCYKFIVIYFII